MAKNILIVDDSSTIRKLISFTLKFKGYNVITANDGTEALEKLKSGQIDLAILDLLMPKMDGFELITKMKGNDVYKKIPIVVLTIAGEEENKEKALNLGADSFLAKPFQPPQLIAKVEEFVK